jgi:anti-sigma regulatory factor (Ser/Thr protein kinase)
MTPGPRLQWPINDDLTTLRRHVQDYASGVSLSGQRLDDVLIAANEAAINVLEHGGGNGTLSIWHDERGLIVEVTDSVGTLTSSHLDRERPDPSTPRGFGLWLIQQLCDEVSVDHPSGLSRIRMRVSLP